MKVIFNILLILNISLGYAHEDIVVTKNYGNVKVTTYTGHYYEEINKTLMIGQYANILTEKINFTSKVNLIFSHNYTRNVKDNYSAWIYRSSNRIDSITIRANCFNNSTKDVLQILEYLIINNENKLGDSEIKKILLKEKSVVVNETLNIKIDRPQEIDELKSKYATTYYLQNEKYHIVKKIDGNEKEIIILEEVFQFNPQSNNELIVFPTPNSFYYIENRNINKYEIEGAKDYYYPYWAESLGTNKILFKFSSFSDIADRVMILYPDRHELIQNIDEMIMYQN